jgi:hypothetical protein
VKNIAFAADCQQPPTFPKPAFRFKRRTFDNAFGTGSFNIIFGFLLKTLIPRAT